MVNSNANTLNLRGIIYYSDNHFTLRMISAGGQVCFHDGMVSQESCIEHGILEKLSNNNLKRSRQNLVLAVYAYNQKMEDMVK